MHYKDALRAAKRMGAAHATGDPELAQVCLILSFVHAVNPQCLYRGAQLQGLSGSALTKLADTNLEEFATIQLF